MWRKTYLGPHPYSRSIHEGAYAWTREFNRAERHRLVEEDRTARNTVLLVLALAMVSGMGLLVTTIVWFIA